MICNKQVFFLATENINAGIVHIHREKDETKKTRTQSLERIQPWPWAQLRIVGEIAEFLGDGAQTLS